MGFWFFQDTVQANPGGTFSGNHQIGDILVLIHFHQSAGEGPEVHIYEWNPPLADAADNLRLVASGLGGECGDVPLLPSCVTTNHVEEPSPWPYEPKQGTPGFFPPESFIEGGVNLTQVLGGEICFSSFMAETRSSSSVTATLKDFVLGTFPICGIEVDKTCDVISLTATPAFQVDFSGFVTNTGAGSFPAGSIITVVDDAGTPGDPADDVQIVEVLGAPLDPGGQVPFQGSFESSMNPPYNTVYASIEAFGAVTVADPYSIECTPLQLNPALQLTKTCSVSLETVNGYLVVRVDLQGDVTNTGDVPLMVTVEDDDAGVLLGPIEILPGITEVFSSFYYPATAEGGVTDPDLAAFSGNVTATGTSPFIVEPVVEVLAANCTLCP
jgi:hypothetical protein